MHREIGTTEKQLRALWDRAQYRVYHPKNWLKLTSLKKQFDLEFIRYKDITIRVPTGKVPDCDTCLEICCTGPNSLVSLRLQDIAALVDAGLDAHITHERQKYGLNVVNHFANAAQKNFAESVFAEVFPVLTQDRTQTCLLLGEDLKCKGFPAWPISCARYPYAIDAINRVVFYAKGCESFEVLSPYEAAGRTRYLVQAAIESYNERIKDILLLHFARDELRDMGLLKYLRLDALI
jgi:hypothetical protein